MVVAALTAWVVSLLVCGWIVRNGGIQAHALAYRHDMPQRFHEGAVSRLGGLGIAGGSVCVWLVGGLVDEVPWGPRLSLSFTTSLQWVAVMFPLVLAGVAEDLTHRVPVALRLALSLAGASLAALLLDVNIGNLGIDWLNLYWQSVPWGGKVLAVVAIAGLPHAFNLVDGYNGLAGTVAIMICLALVHVALQVGDRQLAAMLVALVGATAGFLIWNYPKGLIFAGDGGAYLWGGVIAIASITLVQRHEEVSPWFPMLLLIYPVWETVFSIYRKLARGVSPGVADALHFHQLIYRRIVREVFHDDEARRMLMRNNRTSPYLWGFTLLTVIPAVLFWRNTPVLMGFCLLFVLTYVPAYIMIVRFKVPRWVRRGRKR
ncbi:MAG: glycosyltransferase [Burkholderiaceae bacterium]|jgi:UDP-N-acetylmuramyl pentapeptide phosphotransferase/UDP-N-acetylglucosamine-1-phosphate transferase|nr:glycosyltransferase [Burkholderiaceae bacterium]